MRRPPILSSAAIWRPIPQKEIGCEEARCEEQIVGSQGEAEAGLSIKELCRKHGVGERPATCRAADTAA